MSHHNLLIASEILHKQTPKFKDLDIAGQTTQMNSLVKLYESDDTFEVHKSLIKELINARRLRLKLSIMLMAKLEIEQNHELINLSKLIENAS